MIARTTARSQALALGLALLFVATAPACSLSGDEDMGGCPFTDATQPKTDPGTPCLTVSVLNGEGNGSIGGCVWPDLAITNGCAEALVVHDVVLLEDRDHLPPAPHVNEPAEVTIAAGATGYVEVRRTGDVAVAAILGQAPLTIRFTTDR